MIKYLLAVLLLCGCAAKQHAAPECKELFVILPGNFVIDLAAGSEVWLDPARQDFAVFCTPTDARAALDRSPDLPGEWHIYRLTGTADELIRERARGEYELIRPALLADWVEY